MYTRPALQVSAGSRNSEIGVLSTSHCKREFRVIMILFIARYTARMTFKYCLNLLHQSKVEHFCRRSISGQNTGIFHIPDDLVDAFSCAGEVSHLRTYSVDPWISRVRSGKTRVSTCKCDWREDPLSDPSRRKHDTCLVYPGWDNQLFHMHC
jgi:hypothetical protein